MQLVRFLQHFSPYNVNEVASFSPEQAALFVKRGIATLVVDTPVIAKDIPVNVEHGIPSASDVEGDGDEAASEIEDEEIEDEEIGSPARGRGKGKKS